MTAAFLIVGLSIGLAVGAGAVWLWARTALAAKDDAVASPSDRGATRRALSGEVADLLYHTLVLLAERGVPPSEVIAVLRARHTR